VRLRVAAGRCGFKEKMLDNMCVNYLKRSCAPYLKNLMNNCLPNTPFDVIVEHAFQFERAQEFYKNQRKTVKRKIEDTNLDEEVISDPERSQSKIRKEIENQKQDLNKSIKQLESSVTSKFTRLEPLIETVNNLGVPRLIPSPKFSNQNSNRLNYNKNIFNNSNTRRNNCNKNSNNRTRNFINACMHCAKPNHKYYECKSATETDRNTIKRLLKERRFDFATLRRNAEKIAEKSDR
jgi:hypothetical protein